MGVTEQPEPQEATASMDPKVEQEAEEEITEAREAREEM